MQFETGLRMMLLLLLRFASSAFDLETVQRARVADGNGRESYRVDVVLPPCASFEHCTSFVDRVSSLPPQLLIPWLWPLAPSH